MDPAVATVIVAGIGSIPASIAAWASLKTKTATTRNGGENNPATLPDKLAAVLAEVIGLRTDVTDLRAEVVHTRTDVAEVKGDVSDVRGDFAKHMNWSSEETSRLWSAIKKRPA